MGKDVISPSPRHSERPQQIKPDSLAWHINQFDTNPAAHGLDANWYKFHGIGFLMNAQMHLLPQHAEHDEAQRTVWAEQTKRDVLGFALEYLSKGLVFSYKYKIDTKLDGSQELVDPLYGNRGAVEMIDAKERGGVVKDNMKKIQEFFVDPATKDGAMVVVPSPKGPSGLITDDGKPIEYLTSFLFVMQKKGDEVVGSTIKTDFTNKEYRALIKTLTGKTLPFDASIQDFVKAVAMIQPNERREGVQTPEDVVGLMRDIKLSYSGKDSAFENRSWNEVYDGIAKGEALYNFNKATQQYIADFMAYVDEGGHSRLELQKAVAATLLRVSQVFLEEQGTRAINSQLIATGERQQGSGAPLPPPVRMSFGEVYGEVKKIKGCAGGGTSEGNATSVGTMGGYRGGRVGFGGGEDESSWFECPKCERRTQPPVGEQCPHCNYSKQEFIKDHPELAC